MQTTQFYPLIQTHDVAGAVSFFKRVLGLKLMFESDWYCHLQSASDASLNITVLQADHETIPAGYRGETQGLILSFEVDNVDAEHDRLLGLGVEVVQDLKDEPQGQRHAIYKGPNGILIDIITPIPPSAEFLADYAKEAIPA